MGIHLLSLAEYLPPDFLTLQTVAVALACYLYGSIPFAYLSVYLLKRERITEQGTGNVGVANAFGVGGLPAGFCAVAGEASKVAVPLVLSNAFYDGMLAVSLAFVLFAVLGTHFPVFMRMKGGQGSTMLLWTLLLVSPLTLLFFAAVFGAAFFLARNRHHAWIVGHACLPVEAFIVEGDLPLLVFGLLVAVLYIVRYRPGRSDYAYYRNRMWLLNLIDRRLRKARYVLDIGQAKDAAQVGLKARRLRFLARAGARIPRSYVCRSAAYEEFSSGSADVLPRLRDEFARLAGGNARLTSTGTSSSRA